NRGIGRHEMIMRLDHYYFLFTRIYPQVGEQFEAERLVPGFHHYHDDVADADGGARSQRDFRRPKALPGFGCETDNLTVDGDPFSGGRSYFPSNPQRHLSAYTRSEAQSNGNGIPNRPNNDVLHLALDKGPQDRRIVR